MLNALFVALAGAVGTLCRYGIGVGLSRVSLRFPTGTFTANVVGSFMIGFVMATFIVRGQADSRARIVLTTGFLGGFTTYSAFAYETVDMIEQRQLGSALFYVGATFATAALACFAGVLVARAFR